MATNNKVGLGRPSNIKVVNDVVARHKILKDEVMQALKELSERAEGLAIERCGTTASSALLQFPGGT